MAKAYGLPTWLLGVPRDPTEEELYREAEWLNLQAEIKALPETRASEDPPTFDMEIVEEVIQYQRGGAST